MSSGYARLLFAGLAGKADVIIIDGPPILSAADATLLSRQVDGVVIVLESSHTERDQAVRAVSILQQAGARILGAIFNRAAPKSGMDVYRPYGSEFEDENSQSDQAVWWRIPFPRGVDLARVTNGSGNGHKQIQDETEK